MIIGLLFDSRYDYSLSLIGTECSCPNDHWDRWDAIFDALDWACSESSRIEI